MNYYNLFSYSPVGNILVVSARCLYKQCCLSNLRSQCLFSEHKFPQVELLVKRVFKSAISLSIVRLISTKDCSHSCPQKHYINVLFATLLPAQDVSRLHFYSSDGRKKVSLVSFDLNFHGYFITCCKYFLAGFHLA